MLRKLLIPLLVVVAGCTSQPTTTTLPSPDSTPPSMPATTATQPPRTLTVWHSLTEAQGVALGDVVAAFEATRPWVTVEVRFVPFEDVTTQIVDEHPDLLLTSHLTALGLMAAGTIVAPPAQILDRLAPPVRQVVGDSPAGVPYAQAGIVLYRNPSLEFLAAPSFDAMAADALIDPGWAYSGGLFFSVCGGGSTVDGVPDFSGPEAECWLDLLSALPLAEVYGTDDINGFLAGEVSTIVEGTWMAPYLSEALPEIDIDAFPGQDGRTGGGFLTVELATFVVGHSDLAGDFASFMLTATAQRTMADVGLLPVTESIEITIPLLEGARVALAGAVSLPPSPACEQRVDALVRSWVGGQMTRDVIAAELSKITSEGC